MPTDDRSTLTTEEMLRLQALGALVRASHRRRERDLHIDTVVLVVRQQRDAGVPWPTLARAVGFSASTLRRWRRRDRQEKPSVPVRTEPTIPEPDRGPRSGSGPPAGPSADATSTAHISQSQHLNRASTANSVSSSGTSSVGWSAESRPTRRRVLILTGDPRPGGNTFDPEVACIRDRLNGTTVGHSHLAMISLGEIATGIDRERPAVLHICAHRGLGGLALGMDGREHVVSPDDLAEAIERARHRPRCAVLSFCSSAELAPRLARRLPAVITWPGPVEDDQAACFTGQLYRQIACGVRLPAGVTEAGAWWQRGGRTLRCRPCAVRGATRCYEPTASPLRLGRARCQPHRRQVVGVPSGQMQLDVKVMPMPWLPTAG